MKLRLSRIVPVVVVLAVVFAGALFALATSAQPAAAFGAWAHGTATGCSCHNNGTPTDATCTACHTGFKSPPGMNCWSCHAPGQAPVISASPSASASSSPSVSPSASPSASPSSGCSQECHLWDPTTNNYDIPFSHGMNPHLGSSPQCLDCHSASTSSTDPGASPHHNGQTAGFTECTACHAGKQEHAGQVACTQCHKTAEAFHLYQASSPGFAKCSTCHKMKHAGKTVPQSKCTACHKGSNGQAVQHSSKITKKYVCSTCHDNKLHASRVSKKVKSCRTCHTGKYHAKQKLPSRSVCTKCHASALRHANGYVCWLCHKPAVHNPRPSPVNLKK